MNNKELIHKVHEDLVKNQQPTQTISTKKEQLEKDFANHFMQELQRRILIAEKAHEMDKKVIIVDIDGTICSQVGDPSKPVNQDNTDEVGGLDNAKPFTKRIEYLNMLHDEGHFIHYWTSRGCWTGVDLLERTRKQLDSWGVKYNDVAVFKPFYDIWIDDKAVRVAHDTEGATSDFIPKIKEALDIKY